MSQIKELIEEIDEQLMKKQYETTKDVIEVVGKFVKEKQLLLYGGFAINLLLPKKNKFYKEYTINDYDCFSKNAKEDATELAELLQKKGFKYIKIRKAIHDSTFKIFVDFVSVLDITQMNKQVYDSFLDISKREQKTTIYKYYKESYMLAPYSLLMSNMHYELARPLSSYYRWEKIYQRQYVFAKLIHPIMIDHKSQSKSNKVLNKIVKFIKDNKYIIVNEYALKYYDINHPIFDTNEISILCIDIEKAKKSIDVYIKENLGTHKIITEHNKMSGLLMYDNYKITIVNKEDGHRVVITIIDASQDCLSVVSKKRNNIGSLNTIMYFMYRKYLLQQLSGNPSLDLWKGIRYMEYHVQEKMISDPKHLLSTNCYGINQSLKDMLAGKWKKKQTLLYF